MSITSSAVSFTFSSTTLIFLYFKRGFKCLSLNRYARYFILYSEMDVKSAVYHAGLSMAVRKNAHRGFVNDKIQVW